jgi:hypothetical protein
MWNRYYVCLSWLVLTTAALFWTTGCGSDSQAGTAAERAERGEAPYEYIRPDDSKPDRK